MAVSYVFARCVRDIASRYPRARTIHLVMDNLSTHSFRALEDTFGLKEANKLWRRFTIHFTPESTTSKDPLALHGTTGTFEVQLHEIATRKPVGSSG